MQQFIQNGQITPVGEEVIAWLDEQCDVFDESLDATSVPGYARHYYTMAYKPAGKSARLPQQARAGFGLTEVAWLTQFEASAQAAHAAMVHLQEQAQETVAATEQQSEIVEQLEALRKEITQLKRRNTILENKVNETEADADTEDDAESETTEDAAEDTDTEDETPDGDDAEKKD